MTDTTRLTLPLIAAAQAQKHVTHNEAIMRLDGLVQMTANSATTSAQPGAPADGDLYLLPAGKTGTDWGGYSNYAAAHYYDGIWHQYHPNAGWLCFVQDTATLLYYTGSAWANIGAVVNAQFADGNAGAPGIAFTADTDTGIYRIGANSLGIATGGTLRHTIDTANETTTLNQIGPDGAAATPSYSFSADTNTGLYRIGADILGFAAGGAEKLRLSGSGLSFDGGANTLGTFVDNTSFTPTITFATPGDLSVSYGTRVGKYSRIGKMIHFYCRVTFTPTYTTSTGALLMNALPATTDTGDSQITSALITSSATWPASNTQVNGVTLPNTTNIELFGNGSGTTGAAFGTTQFPSGSARTIYISGSYLAA